MNKLILFLFTITFSWTTEQIIITCEGNFNEENGSLWTISNDTVTEYPGNPIGDVVQSLLVYDNKLFVIVNGSSNIQVYNIEESGLSFFKQIETNESGPRDMVIYDSPISEGNGNIYFTNWYSADVKKINLSTWEIEEEIPTPGLPEDIIIHNGLLYVSMTMKHDWTDGSQVITIDPHLDTIMDSFEVGPGPGELLEYEGEIYVSRTYYNEDWDTFYGTSKIKSNGEIVIVNYGSGSACGGGIVNYNNSIYRVYDGGIAMLDENLQVIPDTRIGTYNFGEVYSVEVIGDYIYFGLSDYTAPDEVAVVNSDGIEISSYQVGAIPGDFAVWNYCISDGDINSDSSLSILDIIQIVNNIIFDVFDCIADMNEDNHLDVLDIIILIDIILD